MPTAIVFVLEKTRGETAALIDTINKAGMKVIRTSSRPLAQRNNVCEVILELSTTPACGGDSKFEEIIFNIIKPWASGFHMLQDHCTGDINRTESSIPWFPIRLNDIDQITNSFLAYGAEVDADHSGCNDSAYNARRKEFAELAARYRMGDKIPRVEYTEEEVMTWKTVYGRLAELYPSHACREYTNIFPLLEQNCGYGPDKIPQLQDVSDYLKSCTGFVLRPAAGFIGLRDFLACLAHRVFHSTQYIRHPSRAAYSPEPDACHELLGHVPLLADPAFACFAQEIGLASLGASDDMIQKLFNLCWYTFEFGVCKQDGKRVAFGGALLSSYGELQYCVTDEPECLSFEPAIVSMATYPITSYQPKYFVADSFEDAKAKMAEWAATTIKRPFEMRYNPYTQRVEFTDRRSCKFLVNFHSMPNDYE